MRLMYIDDARQLVYLAQPHAASRSIQNLMECAGARRVGTHHDVDLELLTDLKGRGYHAFTVIRNHYDWTVSAYHNEQAREPFPDWLPKFVERDVYVWRGPTGECRAFWRHYDPADWVVRYENLGSGLKLLFPGARLPHKGKSTRGPYQDYHTRETRALMVRRFGREMEKLGYGW